MHLKLLTPIEVVLEEEVQSVNAESIQGYFTLLPKHVDFATPLVPSVLTFKPANDSKHKEIYVAIDGGTLTKCKDQVTVSTRNAVVGHDLANLKVQVESEFEKIDDDERAARVALAKLEGSLSKDLTDLQKTKSHERK